MPGVSSFRARRMRGLAQQLPELVAQPVEYGTRRVVGYRGVYSQM
jgi:hypothetical protein